MQEVLIHQLGYIEVLVYIARGKLDLKRRTRLVIPDGANIRRLNRRPLHMRILRLLEQFRQN